MPASDRGQPVEVNVGACRCPGTPHTSGDLVYLAPEAPFELGFAAAVGMRLAAGDAVRTEVEIGRAYVAYGVVDWTFTDAEGNARPIFDSLGNRLVSPNDVLGELAWNRGGMEVAERANNLYFADVIAPLVARVPRSSPGTPKVPSTSANGRHGSRPPKPSGSSSTPASAASEPSSR